MELVTLDLGKLGSLKKWLIISTFLLDDWSNREQAVMILLNMDKKYVDPKEDLNVQGHPRVRALIEPVENKLKARTMLEIKLIDLRKLASDRHGYAHEPIRKGSDQRDMISKCLTHVYPAKYKYISILKNMALKLAEL